MHPGLAVAVAEIVENTAVFIFSYKGLGYPDAVNAFCDIGIQVGLLVALDLPGAVLFFLIRLAKIARTGRPHIHIKVSLTLMESMKKMMNIRLHRSVMVLRRPLESRSLRLLT